MPAKNKPRKSKGSSWLDRIPLPTKQSLGEEIANSITHGTGVGLSIAALVILVVFAARKGDTWKIASFSVYGATLIILYLASTLYHAITHPGLKRFFRVLDHCSIFLLIAGTYTPVTIGVMRGAWGWTLFGVIWALAIVGINLKIFALDRRKKLSLLIYLLMGWMIVIAVKPLLSYLEPASLIWLFVGGACYTLGIIFFVLKKLPFAHSVWHLFVLGGSICHFFAMLNLVA
ncbi:MAG TPA: hemolysin III family protein [Candidatus Syntrophosphaera sp.]|jgi:hemolysin III|nr:hemolysin III family protein [Candidatus Cloacimonadota bacterium]OQB91876.1 MAG: hemolysin-III related [Candidatus Cloacimonetes bacterium ADurb.Bin117]HOR02386.1 hemolysin III family protein [Candidatus Syntrophosphaera sp.]HOU72486.1 hemolysin III family protein [Candidatus Syntrophosphaera sp.]HQG93540.1 hemolysin III family protein [Candidatus Syntrophosphaera sp.]